MTADMIPEMITIRAAAERTGLSYGMIRELCLQRKIVYVRSGNRYLINFGKFCEYLNKGGNHDE